MKVAAFLANLAVAAGDAQKGTFDYTFGAN